MAYAVWEEWGRATRFLESSRIAFEREAAIWKSLSLVGHEEARIRTHDGQSTYEVKLEQHQIALQDVEMLCALLLTYSYALAESAAGASLAIDMSNAGGIESWGTELLKRNSETWTSVKDGKAGAVETAVVRNAVAHGTWTIDQTAINRLLAVSSTHTWTVGTRLTLTLASLDDHRARLKSLLRTAGIR